MLVRDRSLIMGRGWVYKTGGARAIQDFPLQRGGGGGGVENVLAMLKEGSSIEWTLPDFSNFIERTYEFHLIFTSKILTIHTVINITIKLAQSIYSTSQLNIPTAL